MRSASNRRSFAEGPSACPRKPPSPRKPPPPPEAEAEPVEKVEKEEKVAKPEKEEKVEKVVEERYIEEHEEAADLLLWSAAITFAISLVGVAGGTVGTVGRAVSILAMFVVAGASVPAGTLGGELVYHHGAASAYVQTGEAAPAAPPQE